MGVLDDTAIFSEVVSQGGFSHAAKSLGLSNGLVSRRIAQLENKLGVTLIKRTTRQLQLTPEGKLFWEHAQRIQEELNTAICVIQSLSAKPKGEIRVTAPPFFGKRYLVPILNKFLNRFHDISIDLIMTNQRLDPVKENIDLIFRAAGYLNKPKLKDSTLKMKLLFTAKIGLYASTEYLAQHGEPKKVEDLHQHFIVTYADKRYFPAEELWTYAYKNKEHRIALKPKFKCNDMEASLLTSIAGCGIGKFADYAVKEALRSMQMRQVLSEYDWGKLHVYAVYAQQQALPKRTRMLLEFISSHLQTAAEPKV